MCSSDLDLGLVAVELGVEHRVRAEAVGLDLQEDEPVTPACGIDGMLAGRFDREDVSIVAEVMEGVSGHDCIRLSHRIFHNCIITEQLLREVMNINAELVNARITVDDSSLDLIVDVDNPTEVSDIAKGIHCMLVAIGRCAGLDEFLPLFGGIKPDQWDEDAPDPNDVPND